MATAKQIEEIKKIRQMAPRPYALYCSTCIGLDGGTSAYLLNANDNHFTEFQNGLNIYRYSDYYPKRSRSKSIKKKGRVQLLEYADSGIPILLVPSMINKHYIFDLYEDNSLIRYLISKGFRPFIINWGQPDWLNKNKSINLKQAIQDYILFFSKYLNEYCEQKTHILGYCMGASMALTAVAKQPELFKSLSLVALPFNFNEMPFVGMVRASKDLIHAFLKTGNVSAEQVQSMFYMKDSMAVIERIKNFAKIQDQEQLKRMIALEDWLSDCIDLEAELASDIVDLWYGKNQMYHDELNFEEIDIPANLIVAKNDEIVPLETSFAVVRCLRNLNYIIVDSGHIGIIVGRNSKEQFYTQLVEA
jgi:polyhydroxyalkanoate synthase